MNWFILTISVIIFICGYHRYTVKAFNFYVFPRPFSRQAPDIRFMCQVDYLHFTVHGIRDADRLFINTSGQPVLRTECLRGRPFLPPKIRGLTWAAVKLMCSDCSPTLQWLQSNPPPHHQNEELQWSWCAVTAGEPPPPPEWGVAVKLMCSDCSWTPPPTRMRSCSEVDVQWLQSNPPPPPHWNEELQWSWCAVTAVQLCSDSSWTPPPPPPPPEWGVAMKLVCNDCSQTPPTQNEELQWSWCAVTAVQLCSDYSQPPPPPTGMKSCSEVDVQWLQSNFAVTAVEPPPPPHWNEELQWSWCAVTAVEPPPVPYRTATFEF